jgi:carbamoyl-phosphate synthase small subunit
MGASFAVEALARRLRAAGEVVFNTSLTGYQEIFTDPSYAGQIVVLTNPHIGNYGTSPSDAESARPFIEGLVTREFSAMSSNWRSTEVADEYLERSGRPVIAEVDTRAVVRHLRTHGVMRGVIASGEKLDADALVAKARAIRKMEGTDLASVVSTEGCLHVGRDRAEESDRAMRCCRVRMKARMVSRCTWWRTTLASSRTFCAC